MKISFKHLAFLVLFLSVIFPWQAQAQNPSLIKFGSSSPDGQYATGDVIQLEAEFDDWLGLGSSVEVLLNTGKTVTLTFNPTKSTDLLDANWGVEGKKNASIGGHTDYYGVSCILELEGKGDYAQNKGRIVIAGGFENYEETGNYDFVVTDKDGATVIKGYGARGTSSDLNDEVRWVIETNDGGLLLGGEFTNFGGNANYDYLVKLKGDFTIDTDFMNNLCASGAALNGHVGQRSENYGRPGYCMAQDADGNIYVAGGFTSVGGIARRGIVKLKASGVVDTSFNANYTNGGGSTLALDGNYLWVGSGEGFDDPAMTLAQSRFWKKEGDTFASAFDYAVDKLDISTGNRAAGYTPVRFEDVGFSGILGIVAMPEPDPSLAVGDKKRSPGGVLVTGKFHHGVFESGSSYNNIANMVSLQDDGSVTPRSEFSIALPSNASRGMFNPIGYSTARFWAIDGFALLKDKLWVGVHEGFYAASVADKDYYFEGALAVLNLNGSPATDFNDMLRVDKTAYASGDYGLLGGFHNMQSATPGITAYPCDVLSVYTSSEDALLVGGNYSAFMEQTASDVYGRQPGTSPDDQIITRLTFTRATGTYTVGEDDMVGNLEIVDILDANVVGAFGDEAGTIDLANIAPEDDFGSNHNISINMPIMEVDDYFVTSWTVATGESITIPLNPTTNYDFYVDWGDGKTIGGTYYDIPNIERFTGLGSEITAKHTFATAGTYHINIAGAEMDYNGLSTGNGFPQILFNHSGDRLKLQTIEQWGNIQWTSMAFAFAGCENMTSNAIDAPILTKVKSMESTFADAKLYNSSMAGWNTSTITNMASLFAGATSFNQNISGWNVSKLTTMANIFSGATAFNNGETGNTAANPLTFTWGAAATLTDISGAFQGAAAFNQAINDFKVGKVTNFANAFKGAALFNQPLTAWNVLAATDFTSMFEGASVFNQDISMWKVSNATTMTSLFKDAVKFDQNLSLWRIPQLTDATSMFEGVTLSQSNYDALLISFWEQVKTSAAQTAVPFHGGNSTYCLAEVAHAKLISDHSWAITDGGSNCAGQFITEWTLPASKTITIERKNNAGGAMTVAWGDGVVDYDITGEPQHTYGAEYSVGDVVTIKMQGAVSMYWTQANQSQANLSKVVQFGNIVWTSFERMFYNASQMTFDVNIDAPDLSQVTDMSYAFAGCAVFNSPLNGWDVSTITSLQSNFQGAKAFNGNVENWNVSAVSTMENLFSASGGVFDQNLSLWQITVLTDAASMFRYQTLSLENYDALLISWAGQTVKENVKFHGGYSPYCAGTDARISLITKGWGDGVSGSTSALYADIVDGGSLAPDVNSVQAAAPAIFQQENGIVRLTGVETGITYFVRNTSTDAEFSALANGGNELSIAVGALDASATFEIWAVNSDFAACPAYFPERVPLNVYPKADLAASTVELTSASATANGTEAHTVKVRVVDVVDGSPIKDAQVTLANTTNVAYAANPLTTDVNGVATFSLTSTVAGTYSSSVSVKCFNPENEANSVGGKITHASNPVSYTFDAGAVDCTNSSAVLTTSLVKANGTSAHCMLITLADVNGNAVSGATVSFAATENVAFHYIAADGNRVAFAEGVAATAPTAADGTLRMYATSTLAWTDFKTSVAFASCAVVELTYSYTAAAIDLGKCTITASPTSQTVGGDIALTITLVDGYNNPIRNASAVFRQAKLKDSGVQTDLVSYDGAVGKATVTTGNDGTATVTARATTAGAYTTEGTTIVDGIEITNGKSVEYTFTVAAPNASASTAVLTKNNSEANNTDANKITATIKDQYGNLLSSVNVQAQANAAIDWGSGLGNAHIAQTDASGKVVFSGASNTAGTYTTIISVETSADNYEAITPTAGLVHKFIVRSSANGEVIIADSPAVADGTDAISATINLYGADGVSLITEEAYVIIYHTPGVTADLAASGDDSVEKLANNDWVVKVVGGTATIYAKSTVAGEYETNVGFYDYELAQDNGIFATPSYEFVAGAADAANSTIEVTKDNQPAGASDEFTITLRDANDNKISSLLADTEIVFAATTDVSLASQTVGEAYTLSLAAGTDVNNVIVSATSEKAGTYSTAVTLGGAVWETVSYSFVAGTPSLTTSYYEVSQNGVLADGTAKVIIKAYLKDALGNPVPAVNVRFTNDYVAEGCLNFGWSEFDEGRTVTNAVGVATVNISSTAIGRYNTTVAYSLDTDWTDASFVGKQLADQDGNTGAAPFYFVDEYTTVDAANNTALRAKWYVVYHEEALDHDAVAMAEAQAWYLTGATDYINSISATTITSEVGAHDMTFTAASTTRTVIASVVDDYTTHEEMEELALRAEDYHLTVAQAIDHNAAAVIAADCGNAKAWNLSTGTDLTSSIVPNAANLLSINSGAPLVYQLELTLEEDTRSIARDLAVTVIDDAAWFITTWEVAAGETITIPTPADTYGYEFVVNWGDGSHPESFMDGDDFSHTYATGGTKRIKIAGAFPRIFFNGGDEGQPIAKILSIEQWGAIQWESMLAAFKGCSRLTINEAAGKPDLSNVTVLDQLFKRATSMNSPTLATWDVSTITDMDGVFYGATAFNQDLSSWNTAAVVNMDNLFYGATAFNQPFNSTGSQWSTANVLTMANIFSGAIKFNQDISSWDVSKVWNMEGLFEGAKAFNNGDQPMAWGSKTASVQSMVNMFYGATMFDQNIGGWNISALLNAYQMFRGVKLSTVNYDALLAGWEDQVTAGTASSTVKFHGGLSQYCAATADRAALVAAGWGDGVSGGDATNSSNSTSGIVDGGSGMPNGKIQWEQAGYQVCEGTSIQLTLRESEVGFSYQLYALTGHLPVEEGSPVVGTGDAISFQVSPTTNTTYIVLINSDEATACGGSIEQSVAVDVSPATVGGTLSSTASEGCIGSSFTLTLADHVGSIVRWESSVRGDFLDVVQISNSTETLEVSNLQQSTTYRAVVKSGECNRAYAAMRLTIYEETQAGVVLEDATVCADANSSTLTLDGDVLGDVIRWESSISGDFTDAVQIENTTTTYTVSNLAATTSYRAVVQNGVCDAKPSEAATITVLPVNVGGTVQATSQVLCHNSRVELTLADYVGTVFQWQKTKNLTGDAPNDADYVDIIGATAESLTTVKLMAEENITYYYYRATVGNGLCDEATAVAVKLTVYPALVLGTLTADKDAVLADEMVTLTLSDFVGEIVRWESIDEEGVVVEIAHAEATYSTTISATTVFQVVLRNEGCDEQTTNQVMVQFIDCVVPEELFLDDVRVEICDATTTLDLSSTLHYAGTGSVSWSRKGVVIDAPTTYDVSALEAGDLIVLNYELIETHCGEEVSKMSKLYIKVSVEMNIADLTVRVCKEDAASLNLHALMGIAVPGTWSSTNPTAQENLDGSRFDGLTTYGDATGDQTYEFTFAPESGTCMVNAPKLTVVVSDNI
ncbi:MAG: BspA family leucine-rich repeat surface protein [Mangrovibacterium sp.]